MSFFFISKIDLFFSPDLSETDSKKDLSHKKPVFQKLHGTNMLGFTNRGLACFDLVLEGASHSNSMNLLGLLQGRGKLEFGFAVSSSLQRFPVRKHPWSEPQFLAQSRRKTSRENPGLQAASGDEFSAMNTQVILSSLEMIDSLDVFF